MKDIVEEIKTAYATEQGKKSWEEFMDYNTLTHTSLERMEKHMDEVVLRIERHYQRNVQKIVEQLLEVSAQLEMHQGYESKLTLETKDLINNLDVQNYAYGKHYEELIESRLRIEKLKLNIHVENLKNLIKDLKCKWKPKTRLIECKLIHGSKAGDDIQFIQYYDEYCCEWTTEDMAFRGFVLKQLFSV